MRTAFGGSTCDGWGDDWENAMLINWDFSVAEKLFKKFEIEQDEVNCTYPKKLVSTKLKYRTAMLPEINYPEVA